MEGPEIKAVEAVIDNGSFGKRTLRFETGRLAQQADGAVAAYLDDDSMILSTTTAGSSPKENYDFFPLTVDVEEKMYAAGKIPGSFFRREGRPSSEAILACRIIDRPLRPLFPHTLRNEVQVVETVLAVNPDDAYDVVALNAASASTMISGLPFEGPVSGVRLALIACLLHSAQERGGQIQFFKCHGSPMIRFHRSFYPGTLSGSHTFASSPGGGAFLQRDGVPA